MEALAQKQPVRRERLPAGSTAIAVRGEAALRLAGMGSSTRIADLHQKDPLRVMFPHPARGDSLTAVLVTTSGGLVAGDVLDIDIRVDESASGLVMPQAAEKIYRSTGTDCRIDVRLAAAADSWLEWLPQETILFQGARLRRRVSVDLQPRARVLAGEITVFGRRAMGESFSRGLLAEDWALRSNGRLLWADAFRLDGPVREVIDHPAGLGGAEAMATAVYAGPDAKRWLTSVRDILEEQLVGGLRCGATLVGGVILVRWLGDAWPLRRAFGGFWAAFRHRAAGKPAALPRLWHA